MKHSGVVEKLLPIVHEDADLLAVTKPAGIDVGAGEKGSPWDLAAILRKLRGETALLQPVNRLSRYESGVLLFSKNEEVLRRLRAAFRSHKVPQEFEVVVRGRPSRAHLEIEATHGTSRGRRHEPRTRNRRTPRRDAKRSGGSSESADTAKTTVSPVRTGDKLSIVRCRTKIATTHALRAQLRAVRLDALGDRPIDRESHGRAGRASTHLHLSQMRILHPTTQSMITLRSKTPSCFAHKIAGGIDFERHLAAAAIRRLPLLESGETDAYRLLSGDNEDVRSLVVERYGDVVILYVTHESQRLVEQLNAIAHWYKKLLGVRAVYLKCYPRNRSDVQDAELRAHHAALPFAGEPVAPQIHIVERGLSYIVRPYDGFAVGFYPDQRDNRARLRTLAAGKDVLNLFAYTCSLSVVAASGGARSTTNVDLSQKGLEWGRENFAANYLLDDRHAFIQSDVATFVKRAHKESRQFDVAIVDPPSFAHGRKRGQSFSIVRDLPGVLRGVTTLLRPDGVILLTTNHRRTKLGRLRDWLKEGAGRRRFRVLETPRLPDDYAVDTDHAKTIIAQFE